ncbi:MAG: potassium channel family protein [Candidatus Methanoperedens sp.]|nr:potassium channel family protein [Candidatus Methanoperedens sp.]CAG0980899.1 Voltage-gated potassium channel Kch [Methanosarcinales archaeon]
MFKFRISKSIFVYISISTLLVFIYSLVFQYLMSAYEGREYGFITAIYWVVGSMTTVGYGDIYFNSTIGHLFSIIVVLSGIIMIIGYVFLFAVHPRLEGMLRKEMPPKPKVPVDLKNHIIIIGYNQLVETLITELDEAKISFMVIDEDEENINHLISRKIPCVHGDAADENVLLNSNILSARMLIANQSDKKNASIILTARKLSNIKIKSLVKDMKNARYLKYAGSDQVISPKTLSDHTLYEELSIQ